MSNRDQTPPAEFSTSTGKLVIAWGLSDEAGEDALTYRLPGGAGEVEWLKDAIEGPRYSPSPWNFGAYAVGPSLAEELDRRGYDVSTLRFTISLKRAATERACNDSGAMAQGAQIYRFLENGEAILQGDECIASDQQSWAPVTPALLGEPYGPLLRPIRRCMGSEAGLASLVQANFELAKVINTLSAENAQLRERTNRCGSAESGRAATRTEIAKEALQWATDRVRTSVPEIAPEPTPAPALPLKLPFRNTWGAVEDKILHGFLLASPQSEEGNS